MILCSFMTFKSQEYDIAKFGGHYDVKVGDSQNYTVMKYYSNQNNTINAIFENASIVSFNMTKGLTFKMFVVTSNFSNGIGQYFVKDNYTLPGIGIVTGKTFVATDYINPSFNSGSNAYDFYSYYTRNTTDTITVGKSDISIITRYNYTMGENTVVVTKIDYIISWKTGWMDDLETSSYSNATLTSDIEIQNNVYNPNQSFSKIANTGNINDYLNYLTDVVVLTSILVGCLVILVFGMSYKSYSKSTKTSKSFQSFYNYLIDKIKFKNKKSNTHQSINVDKALEKIEEIIQDNTE